MSDRDEAVTAWVQVWRKRYFPEPKEESGNVTHSAATGAVGGSRRIRGTRDTGQK